MMLLFLVNSGIITPSNEGSNIMLLYILVLLILVIGGIGLIYAQYGLFKIDKQMHEFEQHIKQKR